jgi:spermidine/putrescine transport system substrate-binding protein
MKTLNFIFTSTLIIALGLAACTRKNPSESASSNTNSKKELNLAIWGNYLAKETQEKFQKETGIALNITNYSSNEELLAKVQSGASGFDVAVPSDYMVGIMIKTNLLEPLQKQLIPNTSLIEDQWLKQVYDPENAFSLPYAWSTTGIAINRELFKGSIKTWKDVFENKELKGKLSLLDDVREVTAAALKMHGFSANSTDKKQLESAQKTLVEAKSLVKMFSSDTIDSLVNKEVAVAQTYSTDALQAQKKTGGKIEYVIPSDGGTRAIDNLVILKGAKNVAEAHAFINFVLSQENNVTFVKDMMVGPVLKGTKALLPEELQKNPGLFPAEDTMSKLEKLEDVGEFTTTYDDLWTKVKTAK